LFDGATRLTDAASVSAGLVTFNSTTGIFTIPANSTKVIAVKSDILGSAQGQTVGVSLSAVTSNGTLSTTLPVAGNISTIASATLATVAVGTPLPVSATTTDPVAGVRVWESSFTIGNRNVQFTKLALKQINSIDKADISNFQLLVDGTVVSTVASLDANGYVTFTFDKVLTTGTRNIKVLADVNGGSSRYIQMSLRNKADIDVKDADYNVNVAISGSPATAATIQVNQGVFTITANNAALPVTVANSSSGILIGKWTFKASGEAVKVETLTTGFTYVNSGFSAVAVTTAYATPAALAALNATSSATCNGTFTAATGDGANVTVASTCTSPTATLRNGRIMINGTQAGSTTTLAPAGTAYTVNYTFQPGVETVVELYADIYDNDAAGSIMASDTITATLVQGSANGTKQISLGTIDVPTSARPASTIIVSSGSATLTTTSNYGNQTTSLPQTAFKVGSWTLTAGTAEDINVNGLSFAITNNDANFTVADMSDVYVTYQVGSGSAVTTSVTPTPTSPIAFSSSFTLPKAQVVTINLYSSLRDNGLPTTIADTESIFATLTVSGTGAQSGAAASITGTGIGQTISNATGQLVISRDASTPVSTLVTGGNTVKTVSYKLEALNDSFTISQLQFSLDATGVSAVSYVNLKDGSTILSNAPAGTSVIFNLATPITVSANTTKILDVELVLGTIGSGAGTSSSNLVTSFVNALARPSSTGTAAYTGATGVVNGNAIYAYKAIPTITLSTLPTANLNVGTNTTSKITIATDTGTIGWKKMIFDVSKSGATVGAISSVTLWNGSTQVPGRAVITAVSGVNIGTTAGVGTGTITFIPTTEEQISGSVTYTLKADVAAALTGDSVSVKIDNKSTTFAASKKAFAYGTAAGTTTLAYYNADVDTAVTAGDIRQQLVAKYTVAVTGTNNDTLVLGDPSAAFGIADGVTLTFVTTNDSAGDTHDSITSITASDATLVCTANAMFTDTISTVTCTIAGKNITIPVSMTSDNVANNDVVTITASTTEYAANTVVGASDSDLGIVLSADTAAVARTASFVWSDLSQPGHAISTTDWTGDFLVKNLPTDTQSLSK
jgi:hypothetical protein